MPTAMNESDPDLMAMVNRFPELTVAEARRLFGISDVGSCPQAPGRPAHRAEVVNYDQLVTTRNRGRYPSLG